MHRATPFDTSLRSYSAGGARSVVSSIDDKKFMQEMGGNFLKGETRSKIESPQNYGFTSVNFESDKDKDGNITDGPETFISFIGGNRSFPVAGPIDDRRHRLRELDKGDVAMFRGKDDQQQFHLTSDGGFWSAPSDKTVKMQLVTKKQQGGQQQGSGSGASTYAANGGSGQSGQQGQQGQQKDKGQKSVRKDGTHQFVEVTDKETNASGTNVKLKLKDGNGYVHCSDDKQVWCGAEKGKASFAKVLTEDGPAVNVWGKTGGGVMFREEDNVDAVLAARPPKRSYYATAVEIDALMARIEVLEQKLAALQGGQP